MSQTDADLEPLIKLNYVAPADLIQALNPCFKPGARIVNVASGAGLRAIPWRGAYSASKSGLIAQSQALAKERAPTGHWDELSGGADAADCRATRDAARCAALHGGRA